MDEFHRIGAFLEALSRHTEADITRIAQSAWSQFSGSARMSSTDKSAPGIVCDSQPASEMCRDVALEDWDILFDAVVHRLGSTFDELPSGDVVVLRQKWVQARTCVLDCVQALNQLQVTAAHEIARQQHKDAVGWPFTLRPGSKGATADHQKLQADVLRAIWQVWNDNLRVPNGTPPST